MKGATSAPVTLCECPRPVKVELPGCCDEVAEEGTPLELELTRSGMDRVFLSFLGPEACEAAAGDFPGGADPFLKMDWGRNVCILIRERRFALGEVKCSLDKVPRSSTSTEAAAGARRSRGLQTQ